MRDAPTVSSAAVAEASGFGISTAEMPLGMLPRSITRGVEQRRRRILASEWPVVADIPGFRLAFGKDRHRRVVAVQPIGR
jgi:hypothetical protein